MNELFGVFAALIIVVGTWLGALVFFTRVTNHQTAEVRSKRR